MISKIQRRRGRPRKYASKQQREWVKNFLGERKRCERSQQNYLYGARAFAIISECEGAKDILSYFQKRGTMFAEIGRIEDEGLLKRTAGKICSEGLRGAKANAEIRKARQPAWRSDISVLRKKITKALREYRRLYPYMTDERFRDDFETVMRSLTVFVMNEPDHYR